MNRYFWQHTLQYFLLLITIISVLISFYFITNPQLQRTLATAAISLYPLWGIIHHYQEKNLTLEIITEYLALTLLMYWIVAAVF